MPFKKHDSLPFHNDYTDIYRYLFYIYIYIYIAWESYVSSEISLI